MRKLFKRFLLVGLFTFCLATYLGNVPTYASVPAFEWETSGKLLQTNQRVQTVLADGNGNYYISTWQSGVGASLNKINSTGNNVWENSIVLSSTGALSQMTLDGSGGVIVVFTDTRSGEDLIDLYAQRVSASGAIAWTEGGIPVVVAAGTQVSASVVSDGAHGVIVAWRDYRSGDVMSPDIYAQRISSDGEALWTLDGNVIVSNDFYTHLPVLASDNNNGAYIAWSDSRSGDRQNFLQRVNGSGVIQYTENGILVATAISYSTEILPDGAGGVVIAGADDNHIYAQRMDSAGQPQWTADGKIIYNGEGVSPSMNEGKSLLADGSGNYFVAWEDYRNEEGNYSDVYAQKFNSNGAIAWNASGQPVAEMPMDQFAALMVNDGNGGIVIIWMDSRDDPTDNDAKALIQHLSSTGTPLWVENGVELPIGIVSWWNGHALVNDTTNGAVLVWNDGSGDSQNVMGLHIKNLNQIAVSDDLDVVNENGDSIKSGSSHGATGSGIYVEILDNNNHKPIGAVDVDLTSERNWSTVAGAVDSDNKKSFIANLAGAPGAADSHTLFVPKGGSDHGVVICPDATNLESVTQSCSNALTKNEGDSGLTVVNIGGADYWQITNLDGTGGMSIAGGGTPTPTATPTVTHTTTPTVKVTSTPVVSTETPTPTITEVPTITPTPTEVIVTDSIPPMTSSVTPSDETKKGSTNTIATILISVGGLGIFGWLLYILTRGKKG